mmetsp:Transcript_5258/g.10108  ORF Transcript_5258/g.10108 Transcript_5258/m.10108 type:complete len:270 (-) Transcript_5258:70-879(-)|eukprot:scaffold425_cov175-Amphora_coffeaeformis.AAC.56
MMGKRCLATCLAVTLSSLKSSTGLQWRQPLIVIGASSSRIIHHGSSPSLQELERDPLQEALRKAEERALDNFIEQEAPAWLQGRKSMPFECTACGRCCQTEGDVYMSPEEIQKASQVLGMAHYDFVHEYASHTLGPSKEIDETTTWIRLREKGNSCVFLGDDGKHCSIYEARPHQCRTYPFWPNLLKSSESWDEECRRTDDESESSLPPWTPADGGCEGMKTINASIDGINEVDVPIREAYRQLFEYVTSDKRFPKDTERPLSPKNESE